MDKKVTISVNIDTPLEIAWDSWTNPKHIVNWNFASDEWRCPTAKNDVRVGEKFSWRMEAKDGRMGFDFEGTYSKVIPQQLLEYILDDGRPVTIVFEQKNGSITLTETFQGEDTNGLEQQKQGWQNILNNYKTYTEQL